MTVKEEADVEQKKLELEEKRLQIDERLREEELALKQRELDARLDEAKPTRILKLSSFSAPTLAAIIFGVVTLTGYLVQSSLNRELERDKFQGQLVLKAIETGDPEKARANLRFFIETGLLSDPSSKIKSALDKTEENPEGVPVLPSSAAHSTQLLQGLVTDENGTPIGDAMVRLETASLSVIIPKGAMSGSFTLQKAEVTTSADGVFYAVVVLGMRDELLHIRVNREGYETYDGYLVPSGPARIILRKMQ